MLPFNQAVAAAIYKMDPAAKVILGESTLPLARDAVAKRYGQAALKSAKLLRKAIAAAVSGAALEEVISSQVEKQIRGK